MSCTFLLCRLTPGIASPMANLAESPSGVSAGAVTPSAHSSARGERGDRQPPHISPEIVDPESLPGTERGPLAHLRAPFWVSQ
jgi:hypothetical protein